MSAGAFDDRGRPDRPAGGGLHRLVAGSGADLRFAWRLLRKSPAFTAIAVVTLALGIGANTAIFTVVDAVLLRQLPYAPGGEVVVLGESRGSLCSFCPTSAPNLLDYQHEAHSFEQLAGTVGTTVVLTRPGAEPTWLRGQVVTANFFAVFGLPAAVGRPLDAVHDRPGAPAAAVISYRAWHDQFGADARLVGSVVNLDERPVTLVGVMPDAFSRLSRADIWLASGFAAPIPRPDRAAKLLHDRGTNFIRPVGRLRRGVSFAAASTEIFGISQRLAAAYHDEAVENRGHLETLREYVVRDAGAPFWMLLGAVGLILLIACANLTNLLLARGTVRQRELAMRTSLGAGRARLLRQALTETLLLGVLGGAAGLLLAAWGVRLLTAIAPADLPRMAEVRIDAGVLAFNLAASLVAGLLAGLGPAWRATRIDPGTVLKQGGRGGDGGGGPLRRGLVVAELALALTLLVGAGLIIRSFGNLLTTSPGFDPEGVVSGDLLLPVAHYTTDTAVAGFTDRLLERVGALPGVAAAGVIDAVPFGISSSSGTIEIAGQPKPEPGKETTAEKRIASPDYFRTLRIPLVAGRVFAPHDTAQTARVVIVNQRLADRIWPQGNPVGQRLRWADTEPWMTVVGVVGNVHRFALDEPLTNDTYVPYAQRPIAAYSLVVRRTARPLALAPELRRAVLAIDPHQPIAGLDLLSNMVDESLAAHRFQMLLIGALALLALLLASLGIYGLVSYAVEQRAREIGVRMALGARRSQVLGLILGSSLLLTGLGLSAGVLISLALGRAIEALLFNVTSHDLAVYAVGCATLFTISLLAAFVPARRAAAIDPAITLRAD